MFYSEKDYTKVETLQYKCRSFQEWKSQHIQPKVRLCNAQRNRKRTEESDISECAGLTEHVKC